MDLFTDYYLFARKNGRILPILPLTVYPLFWDYRCFLKSNCVTLQLIWNSYHPNTWRILIFGLLFNQFLHKIMNSHEMTAEESEQYMGLSTTRQWIQAHLAETTCIPFFFLWLIVTSCLVTLSICLFPKPFSNFFFLIL